MNVPGSVTNFSN